MHHPKISIGSWAFAFGPFESCPWPFTSILQYAGKNGYDGVEINGFAPHPIPELYDTPDKRRGLLAEIRANGLGVSGYAPDLRDVPPALVNEERYLEKLKRYIDFAQSMDTKILRVDTVSPPEELIDSEYRHRFDTLVSTWHAAGELARREGVTIVWEFEPGFWLNKPSEVKKLAESVDSSGFRILFDTSHAYMGCVVGARQTGNQELLQGGVAEYARLLEPWIGHFHMIDSDGTLHDDETSTHAAFGTGLVPFPDVLGAIRSTVETMEWWCVDFCFNAQVESWGREAVPYIRSLIAKTYQGGT